ncbi:MAG TPA: DUF4337 domain-containing protein [Kofleriaceae bacterium]|jgi:hypothetical protein
MPEEIEVPTEHLHEHMHEAAEESRSSWIARVALSSAILAVLAAVTALLASHHSDEAILDEMRATDKWAFFQAKSIKLAILETDLNDRKVDNRPIPADAGDQQKKYNQEKDGIQAEAEALQDSSELHMGHHVWYARGVTAFQIAIAIGAISVLAKRPKLWLLSLVVGGIGSAFFLMGWFV